MKKVFKRISLLALSALMVGTASVSLASCDSDETIDVFIFAGTEDQETNTDMVEAWAESYAQKLIASGEKEEGFTISTNCTFQSDTDQYFTSLSNSLAAGTAPDIFYVSPKYVQAYAKVGYVLDLTDYIDFSQTDTYDVSEVYGQALGFYATDGTDLGQSVSYDTASGKFYNESGNEVGLYALPKDYSSFGLGYNGQFFTDEMKAKYKSSPATDTAADGKSIIRTAATGSDSAGVINIGIPTTYYPYNFYQYDSYTEALAAGDSVAAASNANGGYTVTIPGYPGDTFDMTADSSTAYDSSIGYITYTYAELSAVSWAICYYYNKYETSHDTVYGNDQYEGTLYLLPWLAGNDSDYINARTGTKSSDGSTVAAYESVESGTYVNAEGTTINYGVDNEEFIETYAAFAAFGSDWNANSYYAGDGMTAGGFDTFKAGNLIFYGIGTWDSATYNQISPDILEFRMMPQPVSEDYALYSRVKDAKYEQQVYMNNGTADSDGKVSLSTTVPTSYSESEIEANQLLRQDQWKGRMDSVGYGVNGDLADSKSDWFVEACADLVATMTLDRDSQLELTLAGSQLPNYEDMCIDYLNLTGDFAGIITPDSDDYDTYYTIAAALVSDNSKTTLADFMSTNYPNYSYNESYADYTCKKIANYTRAYEVLNMISYNYESRNICIRMVSGTNSVTDSCLYTFDSAWIDVFSANKAGCLIAYTQKAANIYSQVSSTWSSDSSYCTPYAYCTHYVTATQTSLNSAIAQRDTILGL